MARIKRKAIIMAGGTGGHIFPGLAIAQALQQQKIEIIWLGSVGGMETTLVPKAHIPLMTLSIAGWRGKNLTRQMLMPWRLVKAIYQAWRFLRRERPEVVIGMGGFAAGPGGIAAKLLGIPLIIHEQNCIAGMTNRYLAKIADKVLCAFPGTFPTQPKIVVTGNPVRTEISTPSAPALHLAEKHAPLRLLVLGGSRGAQAINAIIPAAITRLPENLRPQICHQTGSAHLKTTQTIYTQFAVKAEILSFIDDIAARYAWADIVICRAGASTVTEIMAAGLPAIFIPFPHATDDHQTANARYLTDQQAGVLLPQSILSAETLSQQLLNLLEKTEFRLQLAQNAKNLHHPDTIRHIISLILSTNRPKTKEFSANIKSD